MRSTASFSVILAAFLSAFVLFKAVAQISPAPNELSFTLTLAKTDVVVREYDSGYSRIEVAASGYDRLKDEGSPALPYRIVNVLLPQGEKVASYDVRPDGGMVLARGVQLETVGPMVSEDGKPGHGPALAGVGEKGRPFPESLGRYLGTGYLHGRAIASFAVFPIRLVGGDLRLTETIRLDVETEPSLEDAGLVVRERYRNGFEEKVTEMLSGLVINREMNSRYSFGQIYVEKRRGFSPTTYPSLEGSAVDYVIITTDALASEFQRLADFKTEKGVPTVVRTVEWIEANTRNGVDIQETIRFFIRDAYAKWGITYVLLGGDTDVLPPRYGISEFYLGGTELPADLPLERLERGRQQLLFSRPGLLVSGQARAERDPVQMDHHRLFG